MKQAGRVCRRFGLLVGAGFLTVLLPGAAHSEPADSSTSAPAQVDPAAKSLLAADGLYARGLFQAAAEEYERFLEKYPENAHADLARYALAVCRYRLNDFPAAVEQLQRVLQNAKFERRDEALAVLGHCEMSQRHYDRAVAAFDEVLGRSGSGPQAEGAMLSRAQALYLAGDFPKAAAGCEEWLEKYPHGSERPDALYFLALADRARNRNDDALTALRRLTEESPDSPHQFDALLLTGQALEAEGKFDPAADAYRRMLAAAPARRRGDALYSLGLCLYRGGRYDDSIQTLSQLLDDGSDSPYTKPARLQLGLAQLAGGKIDDARGTLERVSREDPDRAADANYGLAECDIAQKRYDDAARRLGELMQRTPAPANIARIALDHAVCEMELGKFDSAGDELQKLRDAHPNSPEAADAAYRQAFCLHELHRYADSHALCRAVAAMNRSDLAGPTAELDAENQFRLNQYDDAAAAFASLADHSDDPARQRRFRFRQGQCAYFAGHYADAIRLLEPIASSPGVESDADLRSALLLLGDSLMQRNENRRALDPLRRYADAVNGADHSEALCKLATAELNDRQTDEARQTFEQATDGPSDSPWVRRAWFERGRLDLKDKKFDSAVEEFTRAARGPSDPTVGGPAAYQLGWAEFEAGHYTRAADAWKSMAAEYPHDQLAVDALFERGVALRKAKQFADAADALRSFAAEHSDSPHAVRAQQLAAACLKDLGHPDQAIAMLEGLVPRASGEDAAGVLYDLAWARRDSGHASEAQDAYRRLLSEHADSKLASAARAELAELLYDAKRYDEAATLLEQVVRDRSVDSKIAAVAEYRLGLCRQEQKRPADAAAAFAAYMERGGGSDEMNASALVQAGVAYAADRRYDRAEAAFTEMLRKYPDAKDAAVATLKLGEVQAERNEYEAARNTDQEFLRKFGSGDLAGRAWFGIGWADENLRQYDEARAAYQKVTASSNSPTAARAQFQIGETFLEQNRFEQAVPALLAVDDVYRYPQWSARALFEAGRAFEQLHQLPRARQQYAEILKRYADAPEADMARDRLRNIGGS